MHTHTCTHTHVVISDVVKVITGYQHHIMYGLLTITQTENVPYTQETPYTLQDKQPHITTCLYKTQSRGRDFMPSDIPYHVHERKCNHNALG